MPIATNGGLTIESGSATQEELDKLVGNTPEKKSETSSATATRESTEKPVESASASETETTESTESEDQKHKGGWQRRIDKLTKRNTELTDTLESERLARQRLEASLAGKPAGTAQPEAAADEDSEPDENGPNPKTGKAWKDWKEFNRAHTAWVFRQESQAQTTARADEADNQTITQIESAHQERIQKAVTKYDDWDEVRETFKAQQPLDPAVGFAIKELDNSADLLYHLAKNPTEIDKIRGMTPFKAIAYLGKLAGSLEVATAATSASDKETKETKETKSSPDAKPVSSAPAPIKPVGSSPTQSATDYAKMPLSEYLKGRNNGTIK